MWNYVQDKLNQKTKNRHINEIMINGASCKDDHAKANAFNDFFSTVGSRLNQNMVPPIHMHNIPAISMNQAMLFLNPVSKAEILKIIQNLKIKLEEMINCMHLV